MSICAEGDLTATQTSPQHSSSSGESRLQNLRITLQPVMCYTTRQISTGVTLLHFLDEKRGGFVSKQPSQRHDLYQQPLKCMLIKILTCLHCQRSQVRGFPPCTSLNITYRKTITAP
ncbi:hypothetical protein BaRGS_00006988 [Batillaria attramentaria]|uniref:Uncharacterized protein n=1 Tax=Batillaria attramentaria TaxID=370345 RepID=A0ABD0LQ25_9CAEN